MGIQEFLNWLWVSGGSITAASWVLERLAFFQALASDAKEWVFFGLASVFSVLGYAVINFVPVATLNMVQPYFLIVSGIFITVIVSKMFHTVDKASK